MNLPTNPQAPLDLRTLASHVGLCPELAQLIHRELDPDIPLIVEHANEVWNGLFPKTSIRDNQVLATWPTPISFAAVPCGT